MICKNDEEEFLFGHAVGTEIKWLPGKNVALKEKLVKKRSKSSGKKHVVRKIVWQDSFFHFFSPPQLSDVDECDGDEEAND